jgi:hypothetical protein
MLLPDPSVREAIHAPTIKDWDSFGDITVTGFETIGELTKTAPTHLSYLQLLPRSVSKISQVL